ILTTSVSRPQLKSNPMEDRVMLNNSKGTKQEVEDQRRNVKLSKNKTSVTACNESLNAKTLNVNFVCATCGKCVLNEKHDKCVLKSRNGVNSRTKMPIAVPVSTREPKCTVTQSVAKPLKKTVASESNQKPRNKTRKLYERIKIVLFIIDSGCSKYMTGNLKLLINFVEKFSGTVKFRNDQIAPILGYGDLVQGAVTIKRVYYVEGLNHNLFSVGQFCDADLEVAFRKSTCCIRVLKGNDLLTGSRGTDLYSITLQDTNSPNPIFLMAKARSSQAWLWHHRLSHLNFDTINLLSKNDIVVGLPKLKFVKDHLCSSCLNMKHLKFSLMHSKFEMSMMWELKFFLGIQIHQSPRGIFINQAKYAQGILIKHEAEYVSLSACCAQVLWMRTQLTDYGFYFDKIPMHCDSKAAIAISCNPVWHSRTKHIDVRYHFIKEKVEKGIVELFFIGTEYQLADLFTKAMPEERFKYLVRRIGMRCLTLDELEVLANESA
nr:integrase, catalytic region, zinc finger, CCHC-type, peptidase aspartic, catalytic [Tanacetum cinerariifolium]